MVSSPKKNLYVVQFYADGFWTTIQYDNTVLGQNSIDIIKVSKEMDCIIIWRDSWNQEDNYAWIGSQVALS